MGSDSPSHMAAMLECANMITESMMNSHRPADNQQRSENRATDYGQLEHRTVGYARAKVRRVIKELQDMCAFATRSM